MIGRCRAVGERLCRPWRSRFVAVLIAIAIAVPLGIWAARSRTRCLAVVRPILDFLQTMPAFVYLIPASSFRCRASCPGIVATIVFAIAPGVRLTELGIRGVDKEVVEAATPSARARPILRQIQLPLAMPTIMAGVNQVIMLPCRWWSSPAWSVPAASARESSKPPTGSTSHSASRPASRP